MIGCLLEWQSRKHAAFAFCFYSFLTLLRLCNNLITWCWRIFQGYYDGLGILYTTVYSSKANGFTTTIVATSTFQLIELSITSFRSFGWIDQGMHWVSRAVSRVSLQRSMTQVEIEPGTSQIRNPYHITEVTLETTHATSIVRSKVKLKGYVLVSKY